MPVNLSTLNPTLHETRASKEINNQVVHPSAFGLSHKKERSEDTITVSAVSKVLSAASDYRDSLTSLKKRADDAALNVSTHGQSVVRIKARGGESAERAGGSYQVDVKQLASRMTLQTEKISSETEKLGSGTLTIETGTSRVDIKVSGNASEVADMINRDKNNSVVQASVETDGAGVRLILHAKNDGAAGGFSVKVNVTTEGEKSKGLRVLNFHDHTREMSVRSSAQDAQVEVNGKLYVSATNEIDDAAQGFSIELTGRGASNVFIVDKQDEKLAGDFARASEVFADRLVALAGDDSEVHSFVEQFLHGPGARGGGVSREAILKKIESENVHEDSSGKVNINFDALSTALQKTSAPGRMSKSLASPLETQGDSLLEKLVGSLKSQGKAHAYGHDKFAVHGGGGNGDDRGSSKGANGASHQRDAELRESVKLAAEMQKIMSGDVLE